MTHAYDELYLKDAMRNVGIMAHFCINGYGMSPEDFQQVFFQSHVSEQIAKGNPRYLVGHSGKELADMLLADNVTQANTISDKYTISPEYWAGWVLAYYQWYSGKAFSQINADGLTFGKIIQMYNPLHEADLSKFIEVVNPMEDISETGKGQQGQVPMTSQTGLLHNGSDKISKL